MLDRAANPPGLLLWMQGKKVEQKSEHDKQRVEFLFSWRVYNTVYVVYIPLAPIHKCTIYVYISYTHDVWLGSYMFSNCDMAKS
jgi:hypothetical protein